MSDAVRVVAWLIFFIGGGLALAVSALYALGRPPSQDTGHLWYKIFDVI